MINLEKETVYNLASTSLETKRIPDPYFYKLNSQGKLVSAYTGESVEDSVETSTYLGKKEFEGLLSLQKWFSENTSGRMLWISPPYPGQYDATKIIVSEIVNETGVKLMFNRAIVLDDLSVTGCLSYARDLGLETGEAEGVRKTPIKLAEATDWLELLGRYTEVLEVEVMIVSGRDRLEKERAIARAKNFNGHTLGFFGNMPVRCQRPTTFQYLSKDALSMEATFDCPKCGGPIPSGRGITVCPHCGARKEEVAAVCV